MCLRISSVLEEIAIVILRRHISYQSQNFCNEPRTSLNSPASNTAYNELFKTSASFSVTCNFTRRSLIIRK